MAVTDGSWGWVHWVFELGLLMAICCVSESLRLILGEGFSVAKFEVNGFLVCWLSDSKWVERIRRWVVDLMWVTTMVVDRCERKGEREREIIFFNIVYEQYLTSSSMVLFIDNLLRRLMRD